MSETSTKIETTVGLGPVTKTSRGFEVVAFVDRYGVKCTLQASSLADNDKPGTSAVWLGTTAVEPKIMASVAARLGLSPASNCGWVPYAVPAEVLMNSRMHLDRTQVAALIGHLQQWLENDTFESEQVPHVDS